MMQSTGTDLQEGNPKTTKNGGRERGRKEQMHEQREEHIMTGGHAAVHPIPSNKSTSYLTFVTRQTMQNASTKNKTKNNYYYYS